MEQERKTTILLVDDNQANIFALQELIAKEDRLLLTAGSGNEALKLALEKEIDLIILDVQMPGMDGFEVAQILKSNKKTKDIPVMFASAVMKDHQFVMKGFEEGGVDYLFKPLDPEITKAKVSVLLKLQLQKKQLIEQNISLQKADEHIKELNIELQKNLEQLESANRELESFSYSVSHDLRSPLRALNGYSKILEESCSSKLNDNEKKLLENVQESVKKMNNLIDDLLELSRLGKKQLVKSETDMNKVVQVALAELENAAGNKALFKVEELFPAPADHALISQVWINLLSNAVKYSSKKEHPLIEVGSRKEENEIVYFVKDNGAGFNMKYASRLFGVFQRLHSSFEFEGTGIGLVIVHRIITRHGGKVWADAKENEGATFFFSLPLN